MRFRLGVVVILAVLLSAACGGAGSTGSDGAGQEATEPPQWLHDVIITSAMEIEVTGRGSSDYSPPNPDVVVEARVLDVVFAPDVVTTQTGETLRFASPAAGHSVTVHLNGVLRSPTVGARYLVLATSNEVVDTTEATEWFTHDIYDPDAIESLTNGLRPRLDDLIDGESIPATRRDTLVEYLRQSHEYREARLASSGVAVPGSVLATAMELAVAP